MDLPFTFGHAFRQGDVPAGKVCLGNVADWQCTPLTFWPDGSLKHAIVSGRFNGAASQAVSIGLVAGAAAGGNALTEADLAAALPPVTISAGAFTWILNGSVGTSDRHRTVCNGPVMSNFIYRKPVTGNSHLVLWADVRVYKGGNVEIFPWVENCNLLVASPTVNGDGGANKTYTVTIGGVQRFSQAFPLYHHTRIPLISGASLSYWTGTDPQVSPRHDRAYLRATKLVPNLTYSGPSEPTLAALQTTYSPNTLAGVDPTYWGAGGWAALVGGASAKAEAWAVMSDDPRTYRASLVFGMSGGSWSWHYRDESTKEALIRFSSYPNISIAASSSPALPAFSGGNNGSSDELKFTHSPCWGYVAYLLSARWFFLEEILFQVGFEFIWPSPGTSETWGKRGAQGMVVGPERARAWALRDRAYALAFIPDNSTVAMQSPQSANALINAKADLLASWQYNVDRFYNRVFTASETTGSAFTNNSLGLIDLQPSDYGTGGTSAFGSPWQMNFLTMVLGHASNLGLPVSATYKSRLEQLRNHAYKHPIGLCGDGSTGTWSYTRMGTYYVPYASGSGGQPPSTWTLFSNWGEAQSAYNATLGLSNPSTSPGAPLESSNYDHVALCALSFAVSHGAPGASEAWSRVMAATNVGSAIIATYNDVPEFGVKPL